MFPIRFFIFALLLGWLPAPAQSGEATCTVSWTGLWMGSRRWTAAPPLAEGTSSRAASAADAVVLAFFALTTSTIAASALAARRAATSFPICMLIRMLIRPSIFLGSSGHDCRDTRFDGPTQGGGGDATAADDHAASHLVGDAVRGE